ncbi:MAG: hypothetical protein K2X47_18620, partial [Bdellovibrionales bacterium]|nr:hypothetical protein [Bdellovibrionales bacterium]
IWRLTIYDHLGCSTKFHYRLSNGILEPYSDDQDISWCTEVPISKIYAALELGESLTSMYLRINDMTFEPQIEAQIQNADVIEDPLIRCLFSGTFGAYQKSQLKRCLALSQNKTRQPDQ